MACRPLRPRDRGYRREPDVCGEAVRPTGAGKPYLDRTDPGMAFIDFGFLEPDPLPAIPCVAKQGGKLPAVNGKLAVRVAMGYDRLTGLHQQLGRVLAGMRSAATARAENK